MTCYELLTQVSVYSLQLLYSLMQIFDTCLFTLKSKILQISERIKYKISRIAHLTIQCLLKCLGTSTMKVASYRVHHTYDTFQYFRCQFTRKVSEICHHNQNRLIGDNDNDNYNHVITQSTQLHTAKKHTSYSGSGSGSGRFRHVSRCSRGVLHSKHRPALPVLA